MFYVVRWNEDSIVDPECLEWEALDNALSEDDAYDMMEAYANKFPHARIDLMDQVDYETMVNKFNEQFFGGAD